MVGRNALIMNLIRAIDSVVLAINNKIKNNYTLGLLLFLSSIILISIREPAYVLCPRMWGEEGLVFYQFALHHSLYEIFMTAHVGYLTLFNSVVSAMQARLFSVENAPAVSTYMGFLVQLVPIYIIGFCQHRFWDTSLKKIVCVIIVLVATAPEQWLNTTNSHFIFGLITFLIMMVSAANLSVFKKYFFRALLIMGGLTGPVSILCTPTFILKAYKEKTKEKYIQAGILLFCAVIQALVIVYSILFNNKYNRLEKNDNLRAFYHFVVDNFSMISQGTSSFFHYYIYYISILSGGIMALVYMYLLFKNRKDETIFIALLTMGIVGVFSTLGSLRMAGGPRYAYVPTCIFMMVLLTEAFKETKKNIVQYAISAAFSMCLLFYILNYRKSMDAVYNSGLPSWKEELKKHEADKKYNPKIHPGGAWEVIL